MRLRSVTPVNFGPFTKGSSLEVHPELTVVTGSNDCGKSSLLELISMALSGQTARIEQVNSDWARTAKDWTNDSSLGATSVFEVDDAGSFFGAADARTLRANDAVEIHTRFAPAFGQEGKRHQIVSMKRDGQRLQHSGDPPARLPTVRWLRPADEIREVVDTSSTNATEAALLKVGFGIRPQEVRAKLSSVNPLVLEEILGEASAKLTEYVRRTLPEALRMTFRISLDPRSAVPNVVFGLRDALGTTTTFQNRGKGVRRLLSLAAIFTELEQDSGPSVVLADEPEASLHADAQHTLRASLEDIARRPGVQVICATHSPCMINPMRPDTIRVLRRVSAERGVGRTVIENRPTDASFGSVRSALGMSPADSLLYANVVVVVEGPTEQHGLPVLLGRLQAAGVAGFHDVDRVFSQAVFVEGQGTSIELVCRFAKAQGARPVVFVDGDKNRLARASAASLTHPDAPVVSLPPGTEIEDIVPLDSYLAALAADVPDSRVTRADYDDWLKANDPPEKMLTTKRIAKWLGDDVDYNKVRVMRRCLSDIDLNLVRLAEIRQLLTYIRDALAR